jgi:hypothetical protein
MKLRADPGGRVGKCVIGERSMQSSNKEKQEPIKGEIV